MHETGPRLVTHAGCSPDALGVSQSNRRVQPYFVCVVDETAA